MLQNDDVNPIPDFKRHLEKSCHWKLFLRAISASKFDILAKLTNKPRDIQRLTASEQACAHGMEYVQALPALIQFHHTSH